MINDHVEYLGAVAIPRELRWAQTPLRRTRELFESMLPDGARTVHWLPRRR